MKVGGRDINKNHIRDKTHLLFPIRNHIKHAYVTLAFTYSYIQATSFSRPNVKRGYDFRLLWQPSSQVGTLLDMFTVLFVFSPAGRLPARRAILPSFSTHTKTHTHTHISTIFQWWSNVLFPSATQNWWHAYISTILRASICTFLCQERKWRKKLKKWWCISYVGYLLFCRLLIGYRSRNESIMVYFLKLQHWNTLFQCIRSLVKRRTPSRTKGRTLLLSYSTPTRLFLCICEFIGTDRSTSYPKNRFLRNASNNDTDVRPALSQQWRISGLTLAWGMYGDSKQE
jgi:hypothetical protein